MRDLTDLCLLAKKHETDKGGRHLRYGGGDSDTCHEYTPVYSDLFAHKRSLVTRVLEVGVNAGSSLRMWEEYFPNAEIIGFDVRREVLFHSGRIRCYYCDQGDPKSIQQALSAAGPGLFDLIIDDGSHELAHQIVTMKELVPYLNVGGLYVCEDMHDDCHPNVVAQHLQPGYEWRAITCEMGIGKAHCWCDECRGAKPEQLLVCRRIGDKD